MTGRRVCARRSGRRWLLTALALCVLAWGNACSRSEAPRIPPGGAKRIVSIAPSLTEALFAIGAGDRVVGRSRFCDYPPAARALPVVGDVEPDMEAILGLRPDLVVGLNGLTSQRLIDKLAARGVATWFPDTPSFAAIDALILGLGERAGRLDDAKITVRELDGRIDLTTRSVEGQARSRALMVVSLYPVVVAGPKSFADELIGRAGGQNVVREGGEWPTLGFETIGSLDPDVVLDATVAGTDDATRITPAVAGWDGVRAVREGRVEAIRDERVLRAGPRIAEGLAILARALHPRVAIP